MPSPKHPDDYDEVYTDLIRRGALTPVTVDLDTIREAESFKRYLHAMLKVLKAHEDTPDDLRVAAEHCMVRSKDYYVRVEPKIPRKKQKKVARAIGTPDRG